MSNEEFGLYLRAKRKEKGFTIRQLEMKAGISNAYLSQLENGKKKGKPSADILKKLSVALDVDYTELLIKVGHLDESALRNKTHDLPMAKESALQLTGDKVINLPLLGYISAGLPVFAEEHIDDYMSIPNIFDLEEGKSFALKVKGDSMINARIHDGDIVLVKIQNEVENGEIAVVNVDGENATLKRVRKSEKGTLLWPENPNYEPIFIDSSDARIIGKVVQVMFKP